MIYFQNTLDFSTDEATVLTIGKFDGLHMGHKKLLDALIEKKCEGLKTAIFSFDTSPQNAIRHRHIRQLTTNEEKQQLFEEIGIDYFIECPFTEQIRNMEAEDFIAMITKQMHVKCFVVGTDCQFGHNRSGNCDVLKALSAKYHYDLVIIEKKQYEHRDISSSFIREEIKAGNIEKANMLLGYPFYVEGRVVKGNQIGNTIGFPTVNLLPEDEKILPPFGVYAAQIIIDKTVHYGVTNIGIKPTIEGNSACGVETNIFDFEEDLYGRFIRVQLMHFLRPEQKFASIDALKAQIAKDSADARAFFEDRS